MKAKENCFKILKANIAKQKLKSHQLASSSLHFEMRLLKIGMFAIRKNLIIGVMIENVQSKVEARLLRESFFAWSNNCKIDTMLDNEK